MSNTECVNGHFVCDSCHSDGLSMIPEVCLASESKDPVELVTRLMRLPGMHMHGPEHHVAPSVQRSSRRTATAEGTSTWSPRSKRWQGAGGSCREESAVCGATAAPR